MSECLGTGSLGWQECVASGQRFLLDEPLGGLACSTCVGSEILQLRQEAERLEQLSQEDDLTGLPNRRYLQQRFEELTEDDGAFGLLYIDITNFGTVNSKKGHDTGDKMLINVAKFLSLDTKKTDGYAARLGGDEFGLLVRVEDEGLLRHVARRLQVEFSEQEFVKAYNGNAEKDEQLDLKIGAAMHNENMNYVELLMLADPKGRNEGVILGRLAHEDRSFVDRMHANTELTP